MPRTGGVYTPIWQWVADAIPYPNMQPSRFDTYLNDMASAVNTSLATDGTNVPTSDLGMAGFRHTAVGNATARNQYASVSQVQDGVFIAASETGAANAYVMTVAPIITSYATNSFFVLRPTNSNTGVSTVNINGLGVRTIKVGASDLVAGQLTASRSYIIQYDGTNFQLLASSVATVPDGSIDAAKLASNAVTTVKILDSNVTTAKIANLAVTFAKLATASLATTSAQFTAGGTSLIGTAAGIFDYVTNYVPSYVSTYINGQTWQNVTGSRIVGTTYTNSTGRPIQISVGGLFGATNSRVEILVGASIISFFASANWPSFSRATVTAVVPNGSTYSVNVPFGAFTSEGWMELR